MLFVVVVAVVVVVAAVVVVVVVVVDVVVVVVVVVVVRVVVVFAVAAVDVVCVKALENNNKLLTRNVKFSLLSNLIPTTTDYVQCEFRLTNNIRKRTKT